MSGDATMQTVPKQQSHEKYYNLISIKQYKSVTNPSDTFPPYQRDFLHLLDHAIDL